MKKFLGKTESLCSICFRVLPARRIAEEGKVYLEKLCPEHGYCKTLVWDNDKHFIEWSEFKSAECKLIQKRSIAADKGCPYECGLCYQHQQDTCVAIFEITNQCNLSCPICFASSGANNVNQPDLELIHKMYQKLLETAGQVPVQFSGGEPTLRDDLPEILALGVKLGYPHLQVNTNGIRIAKEIDYLKRLRDSGASVIYLQWDGMDDEVYRRIRGCDLIKIKLQALENCARLKIGIVLVPTLVPYINTGHIGDMIRLAKLWVPTVKGIHFQPISYLGRYLKAPENRDRMTIPKLLQYLEKQTCGEIKQEHFVPPSCEHPHCSFSGFFVILQNGKLKATTQFEQRMNNEACCSVKFPAQSAKSFLTRRWRYIKQERPTSGEIKINSWMELYERARSHYLCISGMAFQDVWNIDLERLKRCCIHVFTSKGRLVPLCAYYLTNQKGKRLYKHS
jgi:uncharacterized radical SAM superfamily Fe-S cluster-containing enzyme